MSSRHAPSAPPVLDGFEPVELIGSGGYADVFLFEQLMPRRQVAVKVLVGDVVAEAAFTAEANLMARVSAHPYIVGIFEARVSMDGRPYLVMEYYPGANFLERARSERFSVADTLRVGIQVAGAVETAHHAGILARDIKPANILTSEYGRPGLTDFGIASAEGPSDAADGVSIPWSPPEAFGQATLDARADVYSLAATIHHLLTGRSPFEVPGGRNGPLDLMARIERDRPPNIGRADVPASFERLLVHAMAKDPAHRPGTVAEFARSLQAVESELRLAGTALEVPDVARVVRQRDDDSDDDATRVHGVTEIQAQPDGTPGPGTTAPGTTGPGTTGPGSANPVVEGVPTDGGLVDLTLARRPERRREGMLSEPEVADTIMRAATNPGSAGTADEPDASGRTKLIVGGAAAFVVVLAIVGFLVFGGGDGGTNAAAETTLFTVGDAGATDFVARVEGLTATTDADTATFSWSAPDAEADDTFVYEVTIDGAAPVTGRTDETTLTIDDVEPDQEVCLNVTVTRAGAMDSAPQTACTTP